MTCLIDGNDARKYTVNTMVMTSEMRALTNIWLAPRIPPKSDVTSVLDVSSAVTCEITRYCASNSAI